MNSKYKILAKDTIIFAFGSLGSKVILFFLVPLYTNYLTTEEYGTADLVSTFAQLIVPFSAIVVNQALIRFGMKKTEKPEDVAKSAFVVLLFSVFITLAFLPGVGIYRPISPWKWYLAMQVILTNFSEVERSYLKVKNRNRTFAIISILQTTILAVANIVLLTILHLGVQGYLLANILALLFTTIVTFFAAGFQRDLGIGIFSLSLTKKMLAYSFPLIFSNVSWWVVHSSDKIMIEWMIGASALGIYTAATKIPSLINVIIGVFNQAWGLSTIREVESTNDENFYGFVFNVFCSLLFGASILFTSVIKPFMGIYVGESFRDAWQYTPLLLSAAVFYSVSAFIGSLYAALQKTRNDMWTSLVCALINVIVNYIGIKTVGIWGAIIGTVTAYLVISTIRLFDIHNYMTFKTDLRKYGLNTLIMLCHAILVSLDWNILLVSSITIVLYFVINQNTFKLLLKKANQ
ncbi:MAG: oligosaccharide flippase family protein [Solobacterium sp.]|nr:oligosaccharide flippase family protein [Solobacterium sp.]